MVLVIDISAEELRGVNAGVIPWACRNGQVYVLLAYDPWISRRAFAAFGGGPVDDDEPVYLTAAREFHEETRCAYLAADSLVLKGRPKIQRDDYYSYVLQVDFLQAERIASHICDARQERSRWMWVGLLALKSGLESGLVSPKIVVSEADEQTIKLWALGAQTIRAAFEEGLMPETSVCKNE